MTEQLKEQIRVVAGARERLRLLTDQKKSMYDAFIELNSDFFGLVTKAAGIVNETEDELRGLTLQAYAETGNKTPADGVGIREVTKLEYKPKDAYDWALDHKIALSLDKKSFERMAKEFNQPLDFVTITTEPQATIATNLDKSCENNTTREEK